MTEFTGKRVVPGQVNDDLWAEHFSRYAFAARFAAGGSRVLDIGCGTGYGAAELAQAADSAVGIDLAPDAVTYARNEFDLPNLCFAAASAAALPFASHSFTLITAFEVIEHLENWRTLLAEARRVLDPNGVFVVSTPNKLYYAESRGAEGPNPFHVHEFEFEEFRQALSEFFPCVDLLLQNHLEAFAFYPYATYYPAEARIDGSRGSPASAHFFIGVCSIERPPSPRSFLYVPCASNLLQERERHIDSLEKQLAEARAELQALLRLHEGQTLHLENQNRWAKSLDQQIAQAAQAIEQAEQNLVERTKWAQSLDARVNYLEAQINRIEASRWMKLGRKIGAGPELEAPQNDKG